MSKLQELNITMLIILTACCTSNIITAILNFISGNFMAVIICLIFVLINCVYGVYWINKYNKDLEEERKAIQEERIVINEILNRIAKKIKYED